MPQPSLGFLLQSLPLAGIARPSRGPHAPSWSVTDVRRRAARALSPFVSPTPTLARSSLDPRTTMGSLSSRRSTDPGHPGHRATGSSHPASFTHLEALILPRVRSRATGVAPDRAADPLLDFFPSEVFSVYAWDPRTRPSLAARTAPTPEGPGDRRKGSRDPPSRWARRNARMQGDEPLGSIPTPFGAGPDRLSAALLLPWPHPTSVPVAMAFGVSQCAGSGISSAEAPTPVGFVAFSTTSRL